MTFDSCYLKFNKQDLVRWNYTHKMLRAARHICRSALKVNRKETGMTVFNLLSVAFALIAAILGSAKAFQMFQQNSYIASRYADWLKERFTTGRTVLKIAFALCFRLWDFCGRALDM